MAKKSIIIHESELKSNPTAEQSVGLDTSGGLFQAVALYRSPDDPKLYISATVILNDHGALVGVEQDEPAEYPIASMSAKVRFANLFLMGPVSFQSPVK